jgi:two-component system, OmpR family, response regulator QseB
MNSSAYMIVEQGTPFEKGAFIPLTLKKTVIGRKSKEWSPDISFQNIHVSREHMAILSGKAGEYFIEDLGSKHGTLLNHQRLSANQVVPLRNSDTISLAGGLITFSFILSALDLTADFAPMLSLATRKDLHLDSIKQELTIKGQACVFSEKEFACIQLLIRNQGHFVSSGEIKEIVWPERKYTVDQTPDVTPEEINALVYRIRKKLPDCIGIENIRSRGYILSVN